MVAGLRGNEPDFYDTEKTESSAEQASSCNSDLLYCSFCNKTSEEVGVLVKYEEVGICDECVELARDLVSRHRTKGIG